MIQDKKKRPEVSDLYFKVVRNEYIWILDWYFSSHNLILSKEQKLPLPN